MSSQPKEDKVVKEVSTFEPCLHFFANVALFFLLKQFNVFLRPDTDVKLFRIPDSLPSNKITNVKVRPENKVVELESVPRKSNDNQVFKSRVMLAQNSLGVAAVKGDNIYITRVSDSFEFKPNLQRLDTKSNNKGKFGQKDEGTQPEEERAAKVTSVTMRFAGANEENLKRARENSYAHHLEKINSEAAIDLEYIPETTKRAKEVLESLTRL